MQKGTPNPMCQLRGRKNWSVLWSATLWSWRTDLMHQSVSGSLVLWWRDNFPHHNHLSRGISGSRLKGKTNPSLSSVPWRTDLMHQNVSGSPALWWRDNFHHHNHLLRDISGSRLKGKTNPSLSSVPWIDI